jgi:hypothetical protein
VKEFFCDHYIIKIHGFIDQVQIVFCFNYCWKSQENSLLFADIIMYWYTGWLKSHATHIKIFIDGCSSVQFDWINKPAILLWLYKSPHRSRHVVTCSLCHLQTVEVQGCLFFFYKYNECSLLNTARHLVLTELARMSLGIHFLILLSQTNWRYLVWWKFSMTQELFTMLHQTWGKEGMRASLNVVDISNN